MNVSSRVRRRSIRHQAAVLTGLAVLIPFCLAAKPVKIMPLGDSRTAGPTDRSSYRLYLDRLMTSAGYSFDFVGSRVGHEWRDSPPDSAFDFNHQGMWGWPVDKMLWDSWSKQGIGTWVRAENPDIVLAFLGTTDILQERDTLPEKFERTAREIGAAVDTLRAVNPSVVILLANLYPVNSLDLTAELDQFNPWIPGIVDSLHTEESPVIFVDTWTGFDRTRDLVDIWHANQSGCTKIAYRWLEALWPFFDTIPPAVLMPTRMIPRPAPGPEREMFSLWAGTQAQAHAVFSLTGRRVAPPRREPAAWVVSVPHEQHLPRRRAIRIPQ